MPCIFAHFYWSFISSHVCYRLQCGIYIMLFGHLLILSESLPLSMKNNSSIHFKPKKVSNLKNVEMMLHLIWDLNQICIIEPYVRVRSRHILSGSLSNFYPSHIFTSWFSSFVPFLVGHLNLLFSLPEKHHVHPSRLKHVEIFYLRYKIVLDYF